MAQLNETPTMISGPPNTDDVVTLRDYVANLAEILAKLSKDLDYIINGNLDVNNIRANSITAIAMDVQELSAITANLGHITAGEIDSVEIYGSKIATTRGAMPRIEMSATNNLLKAENNIGGIYQGMEIISDDDILGFPTLVITTSNGVRGKLSGTNNSVTLTNVDPSSTFYMDFVNNFIGKASGSSNTTLYGNVKRNGYTNIGSMTVNMSSATTIEELVNDYNYLVYVLKLMGIVG